MRRKQLAKAKLIIRVTSIKKATITTESVFDNRTQEYWTPDAIKERGIEQFLDVNNMKETLNWNLNGDDSKYQFTWGPTVGGKSEGAAFVFD